MLISALGFTLLNVFVKYLQNFNVYQIVFFRAVGSLFFTIPFIIKNQISPLGNKKVLLLVRSLTGLISMILFFASLKYISMGSAVSLRYIAPIFATVFAIFLLKEKIKSLQWLFFGLAILGVFILKGFDASINSVGLILALLSSVFAGLVYITIRKIGTSDHPIVVVNHFMIISAAVGGLLSIRYWIKPQGIEWILLLSLGVFGYVGQYYMTKAFQAKETNLVTPFKYLEVIMSMLVGLFFLHESYTLWNALGILFIIVGLSLNIMWAPKPRP